GEAGVGGAVDGTLELRLPLREHEGRAGRAAAATEGARNAYGRRGRPPWDEKRGSHLDDPLGDRRADDSVLRVVDRRYAGGGRRDEREPPSERPRRRYS